MKIYVNGAACTTGDGSQDKPFKTISEAASIAGAGDEVLVYPGIYREHVNPTFAGEEGKQIVYRSVEPGKAVITGAEVVTGWTLYQGDVYMARVSNAIFTDENPYTAFVSGDWLEDYVHAHKGEVYLNGKSMYEVQSLEGVLNPVMNNQSWEREASLYTWYTEQDEAKNETIIYANFQGADPAKECIEINVRRFCFYPLEEGIGYITLSGFVVNKAATQWAPPTAYQEGMIGPHWSKGWIIEDCEISDSKCSGISLGKHYQPGNDNKWSKNKYKDGTQTQRDCVNLAQYEGFTKDKVGSHIVRNCVIHDCGQTGIVGNLGCSFSIIENNHIYNINTKRELGGAEIGGIKFHAPLDVIIRNNHFHHCVRGLWLDWQIQGTRISGNLFHDNVMPRDYLLAKENLPGIGLGEDLFVEIAHGPTLIDNNILLSERAVKLPTQGVAFVHNLICGSLTAVGVGVKNGASSYDSTRYTPYHVPHSTEIVGYMSVLHGDVRFYNNVFVQTPVRQGLLDLADAVRGDGMWDTGNMYTGTFPFDGYMSEEEWKSHFEGYCGEGNPDRNKYYMPLPVWSEGNAYFNGAKACDLEKNGLIDTENEIYVNLVENEDGKLVLDTNLYEHLGDMGLNMIDSDTLGEAFEPEQRFEEPDGSTIVFDTDFSGVKRDKVVLAGPFAEKAGVLN